MRNLVVLALLLLTGVWNLCAQSTFGSIRGTVQDASGAVIPGAAVIVHSLDQSFDRQAVTGDDGEFLVENLKAGQYSITVQHEGFTKAVVASA